MSTLIRCCYCGDPYVPPPPPSVSSVSSSPSSSPSSSSFSGSTLTEDCPFCIGNVLPRRWAVTWGVAPGICGYGGYEYDVEIVAEYIGRFTGGTGSGSFTQCVWESAARAVVIRTGATYSVPKLAVELRTGVSTENRFIGCGFNFQPDQSTLACASFGDYFQTGAGYKLFNPDAISISCLTSHVLSYSGNGSFESPASPKRVGPYGAYINTDLTGNGIPLTTTIYPAP